MGSRTVYLKLEKDVEIEQSDVYIKDLGKLYCVDEHITNRCKAIKVTKFTEQKSDRKIISVLKIIALIQQELPQIEIENLGEEDVIVEKIKSKKKNRWIENSKICFVSAVSFFGTSFTIMAFHNDSGITTIFDDFYEAVMGQKSSGVSVLEIAYSIGLGIGITLFFNHIGSKRITKDPTPIEVEMRNYEREVNDALIETADREGMSIDVM